MRHWRTIGPATRYRSNPTTLGRVLGTLPAGATFPGDVVEGECVGDSMAWIGFRFWKFRRRCYVYRGLCAEIRADDC